MPTASTMCAARAARGRVPAPGSATHRRRQAQPEPSRILVVAGDEGLILPFARLDLGRGRRRDCDQPGADGSADDPQLCATPAHACTSGPGLLRYLPMIASADQ